MTKLVIWDDTDYVATLSEVFGRDNIITCAEELPLKELNEKDVLIVLCELNWKVGGIPSCRQDSYGIELVKEFRVKYDLDIPVLFVSFQSLSYLLSPEKEILTATGHYFHRLPISPVDWRQIIDHQFVADGHIRRLSDMELNDIKSFYCHREGILSHTLHALNHYLNRDINKGQQTIVRYDLMNAIKQIYGFFRLDATIAVENFREMFPLIDKTNITAAIHHITHLGITLRDRYSVNDTTAENPDGPTPYAWKVLLLDDEIGDSHGLVQYMIKKGLDVICTQTAAEALLVLENDWATTNSIMVVIADYRLYEYVGGIRYHQPLQGYQFLCSIASSDHLLRLVAFSGLERKFLLNSFRHYNVRTEIKSKNDYLSSDHTFRLFTEEIIEMAEENQQAIESMPAGCAGFSRYLSAAYREFRSSPDHQRMDEEISRISDSYIQKIIELLAAGSPIQIHPIDYIKSPLARTKKDASFTRLKFYFIARRIALWLYVLPKKKAGTAIDARKIAEILTGQSYTTDAYRQILSTNLGLSLEDFPRNILLEEKKWLQYHAGIQVFKELEGIDSLFARIKRHFAAYIATDITLATLIRRQDFALEQIYRNSIYTIRFESDLTPILKTFSDIRVLYQILKNETNERS